MHASAPRLRVLGSLYKETAIAAGAGTSGLGCVVRRAGGSSSVGCQGSESFGRLGLRAAYSTAMPSLASPPVAAVRPSLSNDAATTPMALVGRPAGSGCGLWAAASAAVMAGLASVSWLSEEEEEQRGAHFQRKVFRRSEVAVHDGVQSDRTWVTYKNNVYDITEFIENHPGGAQKIKLAAGKDIGPFWTLFLVHTSAPLPQDLLREMHIGELDERDWDAEADQHTGSSSSDQANDPFARDPERHPALRIHSQKPCNAEVPTELIDVQFITPSALWYIRHHHPVPLIKDAEETYRLDVDLSVMGMGTKHLRLADLRALPQHEVVATMQCSGNRRKDMSKINRTSGTYWEQGAISTAKWSGPLLVDVLKAAGITDQQALDLSGEGAEHVCFHAIDSMSASIPSHKVSSRQADVILALEMNGEPIPRDHGFPVRAIVPGVVGVRNVKWVSKVQLSKEEALGDWQRGLNYKILPPSVRDAKQVDISKIPAMQEASVFSAITGTEQGPTGGDGQGYPTFDVKGWAWAGGGRGIARVDVSGDGGKTWTPAIITQGCDQKPGREWAWVFWGAENVNTVPREDGTVELISRAVDKAYNAQPEHPETIWNVRGLGNNSWFRKRFPLE